jgi:hypothetical protein
LICLEYLSKGSLNMYISGMLFKYWVVIFSLLFIYP